MSYSEIRFDRIPVARFWKPVTRLFLDYSRLAGMSEAVRVVIDEDNDRAEIFFYLLLGEARF